MFDEAGQPTAFPATPGVYAVYAPDGSLQYIGLSRKARHLLASSLHACQDEMALIIANTCSWAGLHVVFVWLSRLNRNWIFHRIVGGCLP